MHVREQIRAAAKTLLTGLPTTGDRVFTGDPYAKSPDDGPFLRIAAPADERADEWSDIGSKTGHRLTMLVIGNAEDREIENVLDDIATEVEAVIEGQTFGGLARTTTWVRTTKDFDDAGKVRSGEVRMEFQVVYRSAVGSPDRAIS